MKFKELFYIFEITFGLTFTIWFLIEIIMINVITYNEECLVDENYQVNLINQNIYIYGNNIKNKKLASSINSNNIRLFGPLLVSINYTTFFIIIYMRYKRKKSKQKGQRKQIKYNLIDI